MMGLGRNTGLLGWLRSQRGIFLLRERLRGVWFALRPDNVRFARRGEDGLPVPPAHLIMKISGDVRKADFVRSGQDCARAISDALRAQGVEMARLGAIMDFGCGCGRIIRSWHTLDGVRVVGMDYNPQLVEWCSDNLPFAEFVVGTLRPPLKFGDDEFDVIYAYSVFTHLAEADQMPWRKELARVLKPGGHLVVTTHGVKALNADWPGGRPTRLEPSEREQFDAGGLVVLRENLSGLNACTAFHPVEYLRGDFAGEMELVAFLPGEAPWSGQDISVLRRRS
ncbi:MAG: hypothetical protein QOK05_3012 [Chloroflexota bacterium]|jgi:SAM-dependent methyltransferase|nr:hypothetical protein [Chloroflexota bacterium]